MRIISGQVKGQRLSVPKGFQVRPTGDRVREALFSSLGSRVFDTSVLDLFAGSGSLGLEALSRGARYAVFVEHSRRVHSVLRQNISQLKFDSKAKSIQVDALKALKLLEQENRQFDLVFLDPPYLRNKPESLVETALFQMIQGSLLASGATVVAEHPGNREIIVPDILRSVAKKDYGDTALTILEYSG
jgi:16S rRNA (guanine966-N2)-methyltransferase